MTQFLSSVLLLFSIFAAQTRAEEPPFPQESRSYVAVAKSKDGDNRFVFLFCQNSICNPIRSKVGYTAEQIQSMNGKFKRYLGIGVGLLEGALVVGTGSAVFAIEGAGYLMLLGSVAMAGSEGAAIYFIDAINPVEIYRNGAKEEEMQLAVNKMIATGEAAVPIFASTNLQETLEVKARIEKILSRFN